VRRRQSTKVAPAPLRRVLAAVFASALLGHPVLAVPWQPADRAVPPVPGQERAAADLAAVTDEPARPLGLEVVPAPEPVKT